MQSILGTARNLSLELIDNKPVPTAELIIIAGDVRYSLSNVDGSLQRELATVTHRFRLNESDLDHIITALLNIKTELNSFNVDLTLESE